MRYLKNQALKCIRCTVLPCLVALCGVGMIPQSAAQTLPGQPSAIRLDPAATALDVTEPVSAWIDPKGDTGIDKVARAAPGLFAMVPSTTVHEVDGARALWLHLRLENTGSSSGDWILTIPLPYVDSVNAYQRGAAGNWTRQSAGDSLAVAAWPRVGLYPEFAVRIEAKSTRDVYLQVHNYRALDLPLRIADAASHEQRRDQEYVLLGLMVGALLMLAAWSAAQFLEHRNHTEGWFALYCLLMAMVIATVTGLCAQFLWPQSPKWSDSAYAVLPLLGVGSTLLLVRHVCALSLAHPRFDKLLAVWAIAALALTPLYWVLDRSVTNIGYAGVTAVAPCLGLLAALLAWRRNNNAAPWLAVAYAPQGLVLMILSLQSLGVVPSSWLERYVLIAAVALTVPLLLHTVNLRLRERKDVETRVEHLPSQDALTGLLTEELFAKQLHEVVIRASEHKEPAAVVLVDVVNYERIKLVYGDATAEQCLLRAVIKLHRVLRDVDPAGRVGNARFGLIIEGITSRQALSERMVKLIASGLIPLPGLTPEVTLQFHVAAVLLSEKIPDPTQVISELSGLLATMSSRTRRPIRFLEPETTTPTPLSSDSAFGPGRTGAFPIV